MDCTSHHTFTVDEVNTACQVLGAEQKDQIYLDTSGDSLGITVSACPGLG